jgi:UPF0271 protein
MRRALAEAERNCVAIGAHPSFPDREGFGRRFLKLPIATIVEALEEQISSLLRLAEEDGLDVRHVKPHGALYNQAADDPEISDAIASVTARMLPDPVLFGLPTPAMYDAAFRHGIRFVAEGFADRGYRPDGRLIPRSEPRAVHSDVASQTAQAVALAKGRLFGALTSPLRVQTICVHGDSPSAVAAAGAIKAALGRAGIGLVAP